MKQTNQQKSEMEWEKEFEKTRFVKEGGSCFECCDYEEIYLDLKNFIRQLLSQRMWKIDENGNSTLIECENCKQSRQQFGEEILGEFPDEVLADDEAVCTTCSDYEVPCCGGCPPCECHKLGTEEWKKWQERKRIHFRGEKYGKIEIIEKIKELLS